MPTVITGTDGINQVQAGAVESGDLAAGAIGSGDLPAGSVIQVVTVNKDGRVSTTSTSPIATGYDLNITPTSTNSKIIFYTTIRVDLRPSDTVRIFVYKNGSPVYSEANSTSVSNDGNGVFGTMMGVFYTDQNITSLSEINYEIYVRGSAGNTVDFGDGANRSDLIAMEIAG